MGTVDTLLIISENDNIYLVAVKYGESGVSPESLFPFVTSLKAVLPSSGWDLGNPKGVVQNSDKPCIERSDATSTNNTRRTRYTQPYQLHQAHHVFLCRALCYRWNP